MEILEKHIKDKDYNTFFEKCRELKLEKFSELFSKILKIENKDSEEKKLTRKKTDQISSIKIKISSHWSSYRGMWDLWKKMSLDGNGSWNELMVVFDEHIDPDYYVVINCPYYTDKEIINKNRHKTILFRMEPKMEVNTHLWNEWSKPNKDDFALTFFHEDKHNNLEWHLSKTTSELLSESIDKKINWISTILSSKYFDPGHKVRIDFVKFLEKNDDIRIDVFGSNEFKYKNYKGSLPVHCKDNGMFPYKYTFIAENHKIKGYFTEKIVDAILSECLCFYWGDESIEELLDPMAYVRLELKDFNEDMKIVRRAIEEDWWSQRIDVIRREKKRILTQLQFFPRLLDSIKIYQTNKEMIEKSKNIFM